MPRGPGCFARGVRRAEGSACSEQCGDVGRARGEGKTRHGSLPKPVTREGEFPVENVRKR